MYAVSGGMSLAQQRVWWSVLVLMGLAYYSVLEGYWSASIGKRVCRLRVTRRDGQRPGLVRALVRALLFQTPSFLTALPFVLLGQGRWLELAGFVPGFFVWVLYGLLFATARRRNGFAGVHEFVSRTRVVERAREAARPVLDTALVARADPTSPTAHRSLRGRRHAGRDGHRRAPGWLRPGLAAPGLGARAPIGRAAHRGSCSQHQSSRAIAVAQWATDGQRELGCL